MYPKAENPYSLAMSIINLVDSGQRRKIKEKWKINDFLLNWLNLTEIDLENGVDYGGKHSRQRRKSCSYYIHYYVQCRLGDLYVNLNLRHSSLFS